MKPGDRGIAQGIEEIIRDEAAYERYSAVSLLKAREYDWEKIVSKLILYYNLPKVK